MRFTFTKTVVATVAVLSMLIIAVTIAPGIAKAPATKALPAMRSASAVTPVARAFADRWMLVYRLYGASLDPKEEARLRLLAQRFAAAARPLARRPPAIAVGLPAVSAAPGAATSFVDRYPAGAIHDLVVSVFTRIAGSAQVGTALCVAYRESRFDPYARNSSSAAAGIFQWVPSSWAVYSSRYGFGGASAYNAVANITVAASVVADGGWGPWGGGC